MHSRNSGHFLGGLYATATKNKPHSTPIMEDKDIYKHVLDTRNFEISLFWQRSNYFLILNSSLAVGFFNLKAKLYECCLAALGMLASILWFNVNLGSKFWQSRWEQSLHDIESKMAPNLNLFAADWAGYM